MSCKLLRIIPLCAALLGMGVTASAAQQVEFEAVLQEGMQNNYGIRLQKLSLEQSASTMLASQGFITPYFSFDLTFGDGVDPTITDSGTSSFEENFVMPTRPGIDFYTGVHAESSEHLDPDMYFNNLGIWAGIKIPLLRGLGEKSPANTAIQTATLAHEATDQQLSDQITRYFRDLQLAYLAFKHAVDQYAIGQTSLLEAQEYQQGILKLIANGVLPKVEENQSSAHVIQYEQGLNQAKNGVFDSYYALHQLMGVEEQGVVLEVPDAVNEVPEPDTARMNELINRYSSVDDATIVATSYYKHVSLLSDVERLELDKAENQKLQQLDLEFRVSWFQMTDSAHYSDAFDSDYPGASALLTLNYTLPVNNIQKEGAYLARRAQYRSSKLQAEELLFATRIEIQQMLTTLHLLVSHYERDKELVELRKQAWKDEIAKFKLGNSTQLHIISSFNDYFASRSAFNAQKYRIHTLVCKLKYLLGELPSTEKQLSDFSLANYFATY